MILRTLNLLGQQRLDIPHLRGLESSVAGDIDLLAGKMLAGEQSVVLKGFTLATTDAIGAKADTLQVIVAGSSIIHYLASESGSIFGVSDDADPETLSSSNPVVSGNFTANQVNYVGLDLSRAADTTTSDLVQFLDPITKSETPKTVPLARTLGYRFVISTTDFEASSNICPIAIVTTDSSNNVVTIEDARQFLFRLGSGGGAPNPLNTFPWSEDRDEATASSVFSGGDKAIRSLKDWLDASMTRMWELGGGEHWYSPTADRNVTLVWTGATFTNGENFEWDGTNLHWKGLVILFDNSTGHYNTIANQTGSSAGLTDLADGECIYVDVDRTQNIALTAAKAVMSTLGTPDVPGSRYVVAWRYGSAVYTRNWRYAVGTTFTPATGSSLGVVKLYATSGTPLAPIVLSLDSNNRLNLTQAAGALGDLLTLSNTDGGNALVVNLGGIISNSGVHVATGDVLLDTGDVTVSSGDTDVTLGDVNVAAGTLNFGSLDVKQWIHKMCAAAASTLQPVTFPVDINYGVSTGFDTGNGAVLAFSDGAPDVVYSSATYGPKGSSVGTLNFSGESILSMDSNRVDTLVAVGTSGALSSSSDGNLWAAQVSGVSTDIKAVIYAGSLGSPKWIAVADGTLLYTDILTSTDGMTWAASENVAFPTTSGAYFLVQGGGLALVVNNSGTDYYTTSNGTTFTHHTLPDAVSSKGCIAYNSSLGLFVLVAQLGGIYTSPDGLAWTLRYTFASGGLDGGAVVAFGSLCFAYGTSDLSSGFGEVAYSTDGINWTTTQLSVGGSTTTDNLGAPILCDNGSIIYKGSTAFISNAFAAP